MLDTKSQNSNMLLAFLTLTGVIAIVALVGFFMLRKGPEIVQGASRSNGVSSIEQSAGTVFWNFV